MVDHLMSEPITREEFLAHAKPIQNDVRKIVELLEEQSKQVSTLDKRLSILEDRQPSRQAAQWGAGSGAFAAIVAQLLNFWVTHRP